MTSSRVLKNRAFEAAMLFAMVVAFGTLAVLLVDTLVTGWPQLDAQLFSDSPSTQPEDAGARPRMMSPAQIMGPDPRMMARSMLFFSSRILPGQS